MSCPKCGGSHFCYCPVPEIVKDIEKKILFVGLGVLFVLLFLFLLIFPVHGATPSRHVTPILDRWSNEVWERIPAPQEEIEGEFTVDDKTEVTLDGKPIKFEDIPKDGSVEVVGLLVDTEKKRVIKLSLRTVKAANP